MREIRGIAASPGAAVATAWVHRVGPPHLPTDPPSDAAEEVMRLKDALEDVADRLEGKAAEASGEVAEVLEAQAEMARDPELLAAATEAIERQNVPAARAVIEAGEPFAAALAASDSEYMAARAEDIRDVCARAARRILGEPDPDLTGMTTRSIVIAPQLAPADLVGLTAERLVGIATEEGGRTSHTAIVARSLGIPAVVGAKGLLDAARHGQSVGLDGEAGSIYLDVDATVAAQLEARAADERRRLAELAAAAGEEPAATSDAHRVELAANVSSVVEARAAAAAGAEGIGLLRTELMYIERDQPPSEDEQARAFAEIVTAIGGARTVIRTFDFGADKPMPFLKTEPETNPALGVRGIRLARRHPELLRAQLRAAGAAASAGRIAIMAPMIATREEAEWFRGEVEAAGVGSDVEVGAMLEVPSAVFVAGELADILDFLSIGTNDLVQYLTAADRLEGELAHLQDPFLPAVLRAIARVCELARERAWIGVCGEAASDPAWALVAVGLGVTELSMAPASIVAVKAALRAVTLDECKASAQEALAAVDAASARRIAEGLVR